MDVCVPSVGVGTSDVGLLLDLDGGTELAVVVFHIEAILFENEESLLSTNCSVLNANIVGVVTTNSKNGVLAVWFDQNYLAVPSRV